MKNKTKLFWLQVLKYSPLEVILLFLILLCSKNKELFCLLILLSAGLLTVFVTIGLFLMFEKHILIPINRKIIDLKYRIEEEDRHL